MKLREASTTVSTSSTDGPSTSDNYWTKCYTEKANKDTDAFYYRSPLEAPWSTKRYDLSVDGLHEEIVDFFHWVRPTALEAQVRKRVFQKVETAIRERWKECDVRISMFGSLRTNLFLPSSDIDVLVECESWTKPPLEATADYLRSTSLAESISVYADAFVPIVKMVDRDTHLNIDISFNTVQGVRAANYIEKVKEEFPVIEPLVLLLKQFLHHRLLNQTFTGGLSSYGLILMLVNFLQIHSTYVRGKQLYEPEVNLGQLLLRFFEVYSQEFNYDYVGISVGHMRYIAKEAPGKIGTLLLEDPLLSTNDVGRSTYNFTCIANAFAQALQLLMVVVTVRDRGANSPNWSNLYQGTMLSRIIPFSDKEIFFREWLKVRSEGFVFKQAKEKTFNNLMVTNTLISPVCDLARMPMVRKLAHQKVSRPLTITSPDSKSDKSENGEKTSEEEKHNESTDHDVTIAASTWQKNESNASDKTIITEITPPPKEESRETSSERSETETISSNTSSLSVKTSESMHSASTTTAEDTISDPKNKWKDRKMSSKASDEESFKKPNGSYRSMSRGGGTYNGRYQESGYRGRRNSQTSHSQSSDRRQNGYRQQQPGYSSTSENENPTANTTLNTSLAADRHRKHSRRSSERSNDSYASSTSSRRSDYKKNTKPDQSQHQQQLLNDKDQQNGYGFRGRTSSNSSAYSASSGHQPNHQQPRRRGGNSGSGSNHKPYHNGEEKRNGNVGYRPPATNGVSHQDRKENQHHNGYRSATYSDKLNGNLLRKGPGVVEKLETGRSATDGRMSIYDSDVDGVTELAEALRDAVQTSY